ncbi:MAG: ATP-binding protein [Coriobacteriia bacterium]
MTEDEILAILPQLDERPASRLEGQRLDFKRWIDRSVADSVTMIIGASVCMANGGGGCVVVGVDDKVVGRDASVVGVPLKVDPCLIADSIACRTSPRLSAVVEQIVVEYGTGRLIAVTVPGCQGSYTTTTDGRSWKRVKDECLPMTPDLVVDHLQTRGVLDRTAEALAAPLSDVLSPSAVEQLRAIAVLEAPSDLLEQSDEQMLSALGVVRDGRPTVAAVLLAGTEAALREFVPAYKWTFLRMQGPVDYIDRADGADALPVAVRRITDRIMLDNPIDTVRHGLLHLEFRKFPELAIREALLNAFGHADYSVPAPIVVEQCADRLAISNPGAFIGGVTPANILRHGSVARNPCLMEALAKLRLVNRTHLGVRRMYREMLLDGKEPPIWDGTGSIVRVVMLGQRISPAFRVFIDEEDSAGRSLEIEDMLLVQHLCRHAEVTTLAASHLTQETVEECRRRLSRLTLERGYLTRGGSGKGTYWRLTRNVHTRIGGAGIPDRDSRIDWSAARSEVLSALERRARHGERGLTNAEIRQITAYDRSQVKRLMVELRSEGSVLLDGRGAGATYYHSSHPGIEHTQ